MDGRVNKKYNSAAAHIGWAAKADNNEVDCRNVVHLHEEHGRNEIFIRSAHVGLYCSGQNARLG